MQEDPVIRKSSDSEQESNIPRKKSTLSDWPTSSDGYVLLGDIGRGAFASVFHGFCPTLNKRVAIKILDLDQFDSSWEEIRKEIQTMNLIHHKNVVEYYCSFVQGSFLWLVMPLLAAGSCSYIMSNFFPKGFKNDCLVASILKYTLLGLEYLHNDGRMHRDVKAGNILIGDDGHVQIGDFGVSACLLENGNRKRARKTLVGTPCWMAPEVMEPSSGYNQKADIWSFGITALELAYGKPPYANLHSVKVMILTIKEDPPTAAIYKDESYKFSSHFHDMVSKCLVKDPSKRLTPSLLLKHKFFTQYTQNEEYILSELVSKIPKLAPLSTQPIIPNPDFSKKILAEAEAKCKPVSVDDWLFPTKDELNLYSQGNVVDLYQDDDKKETVKGRFTVNVQPDTPNTPTSVVSPTQQSRFTIVDIEPLNLNTSPSYTPMSENSNTTTPQNNFKEKETFSLTPQSRFVVVDVESNQNEVKDISNPE